MPIPVQESQVLQQQMQAQTQEQSSSQSAPRAPVDRYIRQRDIIKADKLKTVTAFIIGTGAIGRQLALQFTAIGVPNIRLIDFDTVGIENLASQGFFEADVGRLKVDAVSDLMRAINSTIGITIFDSKFTPELLAQFNRPEGSRVVVCSCVDNMDVRREIWDTYTRLYRDNDDAYTLFMDSRMGAEAARVLAVDRRDGGDYYPRTLFATQDALQESCTAKTTIYCANICAGMMVAQFTKWLRGIIVDKDSLYNIFAAELIHDSEN